MENKRGQTTMERIFLHIIQAVTVTGIIGVGIGLTQLKVSNAVMQSELHTSNKNVQFQLKNLTDRINEFKQISADRYTASQAIKDLAPIMERARDHEERIRGLEHKFMEGKIR